MTHLGGVGVVEHAEHDAGHGVLGVGHVSRRGEGRQVVLQRLTQHAVEGDVRTQDVTLLPAVFLQLLDLSPEAVQVLRGGEIQTEKLNNNREKCGSSARLSPPPEGGASLLSTPAASGRASSLGSYKLERSDVKKSRLTEEE